MVVVDLIPLAESPVWVFVGRILSVLLELGLAYFNYGHELLLEWDILVPILAVNLKTFILQAHKISEFYKKKNIFTWVSASERRTADRTSFFILIAPFVLLQKVRCVPCFVHFPFEIDGNATRRPSVVLKHYTCF